MNETTAKAILAWVNQEAKTNLTFDSIHDHATIFCRSPRGRTHIVVCYRGPGPGNYIVRSLLAVRNPRNRCTWLINGQASTNTTEIHRWGEDHRYLLTAKEVVEELDQLGCREGWTRILGTGALPLPRYLTMDQVLEATDPTAVPSTP